MRRRTGLFTDIPFFSPVPCRRGYFMLAISAVKKEQGQQQVGFVGYLQQHGLLYLRSKFRLEFEAALAWFATKLGIPPVAIEEEDEEDVLAATCMRNHPKATT